ncbi:MAG: hypothetical protein QM635_08280 [Microbacteriaceae bacterium]
MSAELQRVGASVPVGAPPRAMLLPPEIAQQARARAQRRSMLAIVVLTIVIVAAGYLGVSVLEQQAEQRLADAQRETTALLAEQAQYAEISTLQSKVAGIQTDQQTATATEIDWKSYLEALQKTLPDGAAISSVSVTGAAPGETATTSSSPLDAPAVAQLTLTATADGVLDVVEWINAFSSLPGYAGSVPTSVSTADDGYQVSFTISIGEDALSNRFASDDEEVAQ